VQFATVNCRITHQLAAPFVAVQITALLSATTAMAAATAAVLAACAAVHQLGLATLASLVSTAIVKPSANSQSLSSTLA
jgi:hypothetical protein